MGTGTQASRRRAATRATPKPKAKPAPIIAAQPKRLLTVPETAEELGVGTRTVEKLVRWGRQGRPDGLESITIGRLRKVPRVCLDRYISRRLGEAGMALAIA